MGVPCVEIVFFMTSKEGRHSNTYSDLDTLLSLLLPYVLYNNNISKRIEKVRLSIKRWSTNKISVDPDPYQDLFLCLNLWVVTKHPSPFSGS